ncbi:YjiH family protein [Geomicrobium sp. JCM 19038]|uniref:YjiH family protein n=1 Tax=Geomicrobium sp. JCM 19038 TaxID=1460635 RepID=UPI00045F15F2|nr:YjiH family protein [Geomicrobium sp. JCM 19038]GAK08144.1 predicted arginine uptake transporter [Geomicrobium sp. JCM 19038]
MKTAIQSTNTKMTNHKLKFLIPTIIGAFLFLIPLPIDGQWLVLIAVLANSVQSFLEPMIVELLVAVLFFSGFGSLLATMTKPEWLMKSNLHPLVVVHPIWLSIRVVGAVFAVLVYFQIGPTVVLHETTGGEVLTGLLPTLAVWTFVMGMLLPLLVNYGLMEWLGTMARKVMRPFFQLPGRSAVDAMASWMGNNMVSILITIDQYENGYYTKKESAVIVTNFTITSIGFALIIASMLELEGMFLPFYGTVLVGVFVAAIICPRIPPLSKMQNEYYGPVGKQIKEEVPNNQSTLSFAFERAVQKAAQSDKPVQIVKKGLFNATDIWLGMLPIVMAIGTLALIIAEFTSFFQIISYPLIPILEWMQIPEAHLAAPALLVGFADMFLPAILASGIESELTRFVVGAVSLTQLIYLSEIGVMLIRSKIPVNFWQLLALFLIRTAITLPIVVFIAHFIIF